MKLKKGDNVKVVRGKDKGKTGKIDQVFPKSSKVLVNGVNLYKRHLKARSQTKPSEIVTLTKPLPEENVIVPLHVYEREEDLPEAIRKQIHSQNQEHGPSLPTFEKKEGVVYAILPNTEVTEGKGENFIWALVTDPELANKIAWGNGVSGSNPYVIEIPLNKPIKARNPNHPDISMSPIVIRRDSKTDALTDELFA